MIRNTARISIIALLLSAIVLLVALLAGDRITRCCQLFVMKAMKNDPKKPVLMGRDGWLFYTGDKAMEQYLGLKPFSQEQLREFAMILNGKKEYLEKRHIRYIFVVAPGKESIYPEYLPIDVSMRHETPLDQLIAYLRANSSVEVLDLREEIRTAKRVRRVYQKTDTHWNDYGAYIAHRTITRELEKYFPAIAALKNPRYSFVVKNCEKGDLAALSAMREPLKEDCVTLAAGNRFFAKKVPIGSFYKEYKIVDSLAPNPGLLTIITERKGSALPRAVIFRDSYTYYLIPFLSENFSRVVYIWDYNLNKDFIEHEKPQVVIDQVAERVLSIYLRRNTGR